MARYRYCRASGIRQFVKEYGKRCGADFLDEINIHIEEIVRRCCEQFNGHRKTLTRDLVKFVTKKMRSI